MVYPKLATTLVVGPKSPVSFLAVTLSEFHLSQAGICEKGEVGFLKAGTTGGAFAMVLIADSTWRVLQSSLLVLKNRYG
jgi:hypothetical protein